MSPGTNTNPTSERPPLSRQFRPVISQAFLANEFVEANDVFWKPQYGVVMYYYAYDRAHKRWHRCRENAGHIANGCGSWMCDSHGEPFEDFRPGVFFDLLRLLNPLLETASPAEQRRAGSYGFLNGVVRLLEHDPRIVIVPEVVCYPPRPCPEELEAEERQREDVPSRVHLPRWGARIWWAFPLKNAPAQQREVVAAAWWYMRNDL
jgi:hypothetical protein